MANEKKKLKDRIEIVTVNGVDYYTVFRAAKELNISERSLRREVARHNIESRMHPKGLLFHPLWCEDWFNKKIVKPRKIAR